MAKDNIDELYGTWKASPGPKSLAPLIRALDPLIQRALASYGFANEPNMRTTARLHVIQALPRYRPEAAALKTFITSELKRIQRLGPKHRYAVPIPEQAAIDLKSVRQQEQNLEYELGRSPTISELADASRLSVKRIERMRRQYATPVVTEAAFQTPGSDGEVPGTQVSNVNREMWEDAVYAEVDPLDQKIMEWTTGRGGAPVLSKTDMATRLKVTPSAVTQRSMRIAKQLAEGESYNVL